MKLSELIARLEEIKQQTGDVYAAVDEGVITRVNAVASKEGIVSSNEDCDEVVLAFRTEG